MTGITKVFLTQMPGAPDVAGDCIIAVGIGGKQLWKDITPNLKRALQSLFGKLPRNVYGYPKKDKKPRVWPLEGGIYTWGGKKEQTPLEVFSHW